MKRNSIAYILCILPMFSCIGGLHRFYLGKVGTGLLQLITLGGFFVWQFIDLFLIPSMVDEVNNKRFNTQSQFQSQTQNVVINISKDMLKESNEENE